MGFNPREKLPDWIHPEHARLLERVHETGWIQHAIQDAESRIAGVSPMLNGILTNFQQYVMNGPVLDLSRYYDNLHANKGLTATSLRRHARAMTLAQAVHPELPVEDHLTSAELTITYLAPRRTTESYSFPELIEPYLPFITHDLINLYSPVLPKALTDIDRSSQVDGKRLEEMKSSVSKTRTIRDGESKDTWQIRLAIPSPGGSRVLVGWNGDSTGWMSKEGIWVYNHLEEDYYEGNDSYLDPSMMKWALADLMAAMGWKEKHYQNSQWTDEQLAKRFQILLVEHPTMDFMVMAEPDKESSEPYILKFDPDYRDKRKVYFTEKGYPADLAPRYRDLKYTEYRTLDEEGKLQSSGFTLLRGSHMYEGCFETGKVTAYVHRHSREAGGYINEPIGLTRASLPTLFGWVVEARKRWFEEIYWWFDREEHKHLKVHLPMHIRMLKETPEETP
jgi:hypothetical protein